MSKLLDVRLRDRGCLQVSGIRVDASFWHYVTAYVQTSHVQLIDLHGTGSFERRADFRVSARSCRQAPSWQVTPWRPYDVVVAILSQCLSWTRSRESLACWRAQHDLGVHLDEACRPFRPPGTWTRGSPAWRVATVARWQALGARMCKQGICDVAKVSFKRHVLCHNITCTTCWRVRWTCSCNPP